MHDQEGKKTVRNKIFRFPKGGAEQIRCRFDDVPDLDGGFEDGKRKNSKLENTISSLLHISHRNGRD